MMKTLSNYRKEEGFTLIELMIVMVVLGILAGLILFSVGPFQTAANTAKTNANLDTCATAQAAADATTDGTDTKYTFLAPGTVCP